MRIVDAHCHLQAKEYIDKLDGILGRARDAGVRALINSATSSSDWAECLSISEKYTECLCALGIHPWYIAPDDLEFLSSDTQNYFGKAIAVGEIGLDKKFSKIDFDLQLEIFRTQLNIARELNLPVIVHCIAAFAELIAELKKNPIPKGGIIHNFNGSPELATDLVRSGLDISMGGTLTYRDSRRRAEMLKSIYPDHFLTETDCPDIPPAEKKGEVNEPSFIIYNIRAAAEILDISEEAVAETAYANAKRVFNISV